MVKRRGTIARLWELIDPRANDPKICLALSQVLDLVNSTWTLDRPIDIGSSEVRALLERHRITTLVPLDLVAAKDRGWLRNKHINIAASHLRIRSTAREILSLLGHAKIETRVLKGLATAELDYPNQQLRHTGDVDLAIRPDDLDQVVQILTASGHRDHPTPFNPALLYGWTLDAPSGVETDLHTRLFRRSPPDNELFTSSGEPLRSIPGSALCPEHRLVHAAGHFIISPPGSRRMSGVVDVARLLRRDDLNFDESRRFAAQLGVESLVGAGIRVEAELSGRTEVLSALKTWQQPDWLERNTRLVAHRRLVLDHLGRYREVPRGQRLRYFPSWILPARHQRRIFCQSLVVAGLRLVPRTRSEKDSSWTT
jgi:hypothetical protein